VSADAKLDPQQRAARIVALETDARAMAAIQRDTERAPRLVPHVPVSQSVARRLERAQRRLASTSSIADATLQRTAEWFLDNYYLIRRVARQVEEDLPDEFARHLPLLAAGPSSGRPRIEALSNRLAAESRVMLELPGLCRFVDAYQEVAPLTIAELWALPAMLRAAVLAHLLEILDGLYSSDDGAAASPTSSSEREDASAAPSLTGAAASTGVEQAVRALRMLDTIDWQAFFERTNRVEAILRTEPAQVYAEMDFKTCDTYRKVVEALAWNTECGEEEVAELAVSMARDSADDDRRGHVGFFLVAEGKAELEARIGFRAVGLERLQRLVLRRPTASYLVPLAVVTCVPVLGAALALARPPYDAGWLSTLVVILLTAVPASAVAVAVVNTLMAQLLAPRVLPKMDFAQGLPAQWRTLVAIPTLLGRADDVTAMLRQIELHFLSNPDPQLQFALLTDDVDCIKSEGDPHSGDLLKSATEGIEALNVKHGAWGRAPFHLLHREARWNESEQRFMGWERKRGKLEELNRMLRGDTATSFSLHVGDRAGLSRIRFVITLDSDTELPMGSARRLVGLLAHPLNRAVFERDSDRVAAGYAIVQPRIETSPSSPRRTLFSRIFSGDVGFDIYTHACSEVYQDLFGSGIYVGKGIYDVDAFVRSVEGRAPENALVSHDLFEGIHARTALATDIILFESYPENYATFAMRMHRWVRGDWQLLPWLSTKVPTASGEKLRNPLSLVDRWKIADNLRRSLAGPFTLAVLACGWIWLPGGPLMWTLVALTLLSAPSLLGAALAGRVRRDTVARCVLAVVFLAYEAAVVIDAIVRVGVRQTITRKHLLQWTSSAHAAFGLTSQSPRTMFWMRMMVSPALALTTALLLALARPSALLVAAPFLTAWMLAPELAHWLSKPPGPHQARLSEAERKTLRLLARRTWRFFDEFVGPNDQWLPVDNYQEGPNEQTAHRTSPTNIGLTLLATLSAYDFGYIGPNELSLRVRRAFDSIARMTHYQGHLFNWYDTKNLQPLLPRYVSTVDSGNFAGCLLALKQGCAELIDAPVLRAQAWDGLRDSVDLLDEAVHSAPSAAVDALRAVIGQMQQATVLGSANVEDSYDILRRLCNETAPACDVELLAFLETGAHRHEPDLLLALRTAIDRLHQQLRQMRRELDALVPFLALRADAALLGLDLPTALRLSEIVHVSMRLRAALAAKTKERRARGRGSAELDSAEARMDAALQTAAKNAAALVGELSALAARADQEVRDMDFQLLYDDERKLFHIGYNATSDQLDGHYYDLLASEARLASYLAIVKRDVPASHWFALGRPVTRLNGAPALLSWGGTMFEYLMPGLLMQSQAGTLIARTNAAVVDAQIAYGARTGAPWGISESAYARVDADQTYQYRSFGVPGLGFKRGLDEDRVVSPYASILAVSLRPHAVVKNLAALEAKGMLGTFGLFEALDLTPLRALASVATPHPMAIVRSYMAHHQGMLLVALGNALNGRSMVDRFHADAMVQTGVALLNECPPDAMPKEWPLLEGSKHAHDEEEPTAAPHAPPSWLAPSDASPQAFVLSNDQLTSVVTGSGGGGLRWRGLAVTRYEVDATSDSDGIWLYLRDEKSRRVWPATSREGRTTYSMHNVEFHCRHEGISAHVDITVAPADDVEVRRVTLHNESGRPRLLSLTSAGRPVLLAAAQAPVHPAFSSMFVVSERVPDLDALLFARRRQSTEEEPVVLVHSLVSDGKAVAPGGFQTDRSAFFGREGNPRLPHALSGADVGKAGRVGAVIDPLMSLTARVELAPHGSVTLAFVTAVARSRSGAIDLARKYSSMHAVRWTVRDAEQGNARRLKRAKLEPHAPARGSAALRRPALRRSDPPQLAGEAGAHASPSGAPVGTWDLW
jgi:cyclic beta-1,2-glucan synthetase